MSPEMMPVYRVLDAAYDAVVRPGYRHPAWVLVLALADGYTARYGVPAPWPRPLAVVEAVLDAPLDQLVKVDLLTPASRPERRYRRDALGEWEAV